MSPHKVRLLLVDGDPAVIQVMSRMLAEYPDQRFATSGEVALRLAREASPDLVLVDPDMPGMSGYAVCEALKADSHLASIPVIFTTSHDTPAFELTALQVGAADFVSKPLVATQLTARVRAQLRASEFTENLIQDDIGSGASARRPIGEVPRLLIVDDDIASIHILHHTLAAMGDLHFAKSGEEALRLARRLVPDLILLDAHMPGVDGFDVCRSLKAETPFRNVPIAFVTRFSDPRYETRALDLGAADFIAKPYTGAVLQARVRNLLDLKRRTDAELQAVREHWRRVGDARVADIVGAASDAIFTYDANKRIVLINGAACRMFGVGREQSIGSLVHALLGEAFPGEGPRQSDPTRTTITRANGTRVPVELAVSRIGEGADLLTTIVLRDNTDRERLESESRSRIEAETASRTKTMMMSYIAHEMGNPLNGLLGFAQVMFADTGHPLAEPQSMRLQHIIASGQQLQGLMRDVMDIGRFETGKLSIDLRPVDANRGAQVAAAAVSALAEQASVTLTYVPASVASGVCADAGRLHQCLVNLLSNAIKYNRPGGWASIEITGDSKQVVIAVRDNGIGMDTAQRQCLFEPFNRLGRHGAGTPGAGLGLVVTQQLVEAMSGQLRVDSDPGVGSCFTIVLPRALVAAPS